MLKGYNINNVGKIYLLINQIIFSNLKKYF